MMRRGEMVEQIKFYQSGVGTDEEVLGDFVSVRLSFFSFSTSARGSSFFA